MDKIDNTDGDVRVSSTDDITDPWVAEFIAAMCQPGHIDYFTDLYHILDVPPPISKRELKQVQGSKPQVKKIKMIRTSATRGR